MGRDAEARLHLRKARSFLDVADVCLASGENSPSVSCAAIAAINAVDALCLHELDERAHGRDHRTATRLLVRIEGVGPRAARLLAEVIAMKGPAQYEAKAPSAREAERAFNRTSQLLALVENAIESN